MKERKTEIARKTKETDIELTINLDKAGKLQVKTGIPFLNHMMDSFACHGRFALKIKAEGDLQVDPHHLIEDCGIVLGSAISKALGSPEGIQRAGYFSFPMDGSLANVALDLCGRPNLVWNVTLGETLLSDVDPNLFRDFYKGLADGLRATIHINVPYSDNDHHALEAAFKAFGRALREAVTRTRDNGILSTKGKIDG